MLNTTKKDQLKEVGAVFHDVARAVLRLTCEVLLVCFALTPFLCIENHDKPEFWYSVGCYGVFLMGFSALFGRFPLNRGRE